MSSFTTADEALLDAKQQALLDSRKAAERLEKEIRLLRKKKKAGEKEDKKRKKSTKTKNPVRRL